MINYFTEALNNANIIPSVLFTFVMGYWVIVLIGALDFSSLDIDVDVDSDVDFDVDTDVDAETGSSTANVSWLNNVLIFFNLRYLPLMVFLTFWFVPVWFVSIIVNHYLGITSMLPSLLILLPNIFINLFVAKFTTLPVAKIFEKLDADREITNPIGKVAEMRFGLKPNRISQAIINDTNGNVVNINVCSNNRSEIEKGSKVLVIQFNKKQKAFTVEPYS
ncbi:MAG: hypothetical protein ACPGLV_03185 [Bacteroidia bacterium]